MTTGRKHCWTLRIAAFGVTKVTLRPRIVPRPIEKEKLTFYSEVARQLLCHSVGEVRVIVERSTCRSMKGKG